MQGRDTLSPVQRPFRDCRADNCTTGRRWRSIDYTTEVCVDTEGPSGGSDIFVEWDPRLSLLEGAASKGVDIPSKNTLDRACRCRVSEPVDGSGWVLACCCRRWVAWGWIDQGWVWPWSQTAVQKSREQEPCLRRAGMCCLEEGCQAWWDVMGGRDTYMGFLEDRRPSALKLHACSQCLSRYVSREQTNEVEDFRCSRHLRWRN